MCATLRIRERALKSPSIRASALTSAFYFRLSAISCCSRRFSYQRSVGFFFIVNYANYRGLSASRKDEWFRRVVVDVDKRRIAEALICPGLRAEEKAADGDDLGYEIENESRWMVVRREESIYPEDSQLLMVLCRSIDSMKYKLGMAAGESCTDSRRQVPYLHGILRDYFDRYARIVYFIHRI